MQEAKENQEIQNNQEKKQEESKKTRALDFDFKYGDIYKAFLQPILKYLEDPEVEDFQVREEGKAVLIKTKGIVEFIDDENLSIQRLKTITNAMANMTKHKIEDVRYPKVSTIIPVNSIRYTAEISKSIKSGIAISVRIPSLELFKYSDFGMRELEFNFLVENIAKNGSNCFVVGGTGSGKTSFSNMLVHHIPVNETINVIGDIHDYVFKKEHKISEFYAKTTEEYASKIDLLMRSNPMRILVSELATHNVNPIFRLLNSGHKGFMLTLHANSKESSVANAFAKNLMNAGASGVNVETINEEIKENVDFLIYLSKQRDGKRKLTKVTINNEELLEEAKELGIFGYKEEIEEQKVKVKYKPKKKHKRINVTKICQLRKEGKTIRAIIAETKHSEHTIIKILKNFV